MKQVTSMQKLIIAIIFLLPPFVISAQDKIHLQIYLKNKSVSETAKQYYRGKFKAADNAKIFSILDSINTKNQETRPFYLFLATRIMKNSDGALSEELGVRTKEYLEQHPDWALSFLNGSLAAVGSNAIWAKAIAAEIKIGCEGNEKFCAREWYNNAIKKTSIKYKEKLAVLYRKVSSRLQ